MKLRCFFLIVLFSIVNVLVSAQTTQVFDATGPVSAEVAALGQVASRYTTVVDKVYDGDYARFSITRRKKPVMIVGRYAGIDAPEVATKQPFFDASRDFLQSLTLSQEVEIEIVGKETVYDRPLIRVWKRTIDPKTLQAERVDVGLELVRRGLAWYYPRYARTFSDEEKQAYAAAMAEAKASKAGLWANLDTEKFPVAPWVWRAAVRAGVDPYEK